MVDHEREETSLPFEGVVIGADGLPRCWWPGGDPLYLDYHDREWGRPVADERRLLEKLCLEGFQAGLSWLTILRKRDHFRAAFAGFDPAAVASFDDGDERRLMADTGIVRNRAKIRATITNARRYPNLVAEFGSLSAFVWRHEAPADRRPPRIDHATLLAQTTSGEARAMSADLRRRGWAFVGPTTAYSTMEAAGVVNDHLEGCHVRPLVERDRAAFVRPMASLGDNPR